jgi:hypothetical protein
MIFTKPWTPSRTLSALLSVALPLAAQLPAIAQDPAPIDAPIGSTLNGAGATTAVPQSSVTVRPGRSSYVTPDLRTAIVGATDTSGDIGLARRGLAAAAAAISVLPGYTAIPGADVARAMSSLKKDALRLPEYQYLKKATRADRALSVTLTPDAGGAYSAIAELYDTTTGGLVGRGESTFAPTANTSDVADATTPTGNTARGSLVTNTAGTDTERAIDGAVARAVFALNNPVIQTGVVLNTRGNGTAQGAPLTARITLGERIGMRVGTPVEYLANGEPIAYGTIVDLGAGEAVATIAPESAFSRIGVNTIVRNVDNPPVSRSGAPARVQDAKEFARFEREFGIAFATVAIGYYLLARN